jgi:hypothetical protein
MCHSVLLWILGGFILARLIFRIRMRRLGWHGGCGGRRFGRRFGRLGYPIDLGAPDEDDHPHFARWARRWRRDEMQKARPEQPIQPPVVDVPGALELNQRQRELYDEVVDKARTAIPVESLAEALAIVGREPFDRSALGFLVANGELVDDFEHLHHSLTAEQRAKLRTVASA